MEKLKPASTRRWCIVGTGYWDLQFALLLDLATDCDSAWSKFFRRVDRPDTDAERRKARKEGFRRVCIRVTIEEMP